MKVNEVCKLGKGAYGLVDAPYLWYMAITEELQRLGFTQSPFDPCMYVLKHTKTGQLEGVLGLHVDGGICGGTSYFLEKLDKLDAKYPLGSRKIHQFTFTGIEMQQLPNYSIHMSQSKYIRAIQPIHSKPERRKQLESPVIEDERQDLRALIGSLQYGAVHTRPVLASRLSNLQSFINKAAIETLITANQSVHEAKRHHEVTIKIQPIPVSDFRFLALSDVSFASKSNPSSHTGMLTMGTHKDIGKNVSCPVGPLAWGCKKIQRVVTSTLAAETVSLNSFLDQLSWMRLCWGWLLNTTSMGNNQQKRCKTIPKRIPLPQ